jgi:uncharacterized protein (DUF433 family)
MGHVKNGRAGILVMATIVFDPLAPTSRQLRTDRIGSSARREYRANPRGLAPPLCQSDNRCVAAIELIDAIPLAKDAYGGYRVGGTPFTLDIVVRAFNRGATAEEMVQEFPSLQLPEVYQVIGFYLKHRAELAAYFKKREREEKELLDAHRDEWSPKGLRERLLARRKNP